jgi:hypothetical protein
MKITDVKKINKEDNQDLKDFDEVICVYQDKNREDRQAITITPDVKTETLLLCASRLNQTISKITNIPYSEYLEMMKMIEKDVKGR